MEECESSTSIKCYLCFRTLFTPLTDSSTRRIMRREKLPGSPVLSRSYEEVGGTQESQGGGPERRVRVLFRMFFSVAKQITVQVATQRTVNAPLPTAIQG